jgi:hypothetical protein
MFNLPDAGAFLRQRAGEVLDAAVATAALHIPEFAGGQPPSAPVGEPSFGLRTFLDTVVVPVRLLGDHLLRLAQEIESRTRQMPPFVPSKESQTYAAPKGTAAAKPPVGPGEVELPDGTVLHDLPTLQEKLLKRLIEAGEAGVRRAELLDALGYAREPASRSALGELLRRVRQVTLKNSHFTISSGEGPVRLIPRN